MNLSKKDTVLFFLLGLISLLAQIFGAIIILILIGIITQAWLTVIVIGFLYVASDYYRHVTLKKMGYKLTSTGYEKK